jgi:L-fuconolactonase
MNHPVNRLTFAVEQDSSLSAQSKPSRRQFLKISALGIGGVLLAACMPIRPEDAPAPAPAAANIEAKPIIDTHIHLWKLPRTEPPLADDATFPTGCCGEIPWLEKDALMADYNATPGGAKVGGIVLIESSVATPPEKIVASNQWMLEQAAADEKIISVVGKLDVTQAPDTFTDQLDTLSADKNWVGVRIGGDIFEADMAPTVANLKPDVLANLSLMAQRGLMIDTLGINGSAVAELATAVPGLNIVMDHVAEKPHTLLVEDEWLAQMQAAANTERIHIKVSDVHRLSEAEMAATWPTQFSAITDPARYSDVLTALWDLFGEERLIFGTNWPVSEVGGATMDTIDLEISIIEAFLADHGMTARNNVMHDNAMRVYAPRA